jgi:hypothetical protein
MPNHPDAALMVHAPPLPPAGNIPDFPLLIVVPHTLLTQWIFEAHKFLDPRITVVLPYTSMSVEARRHFWDVVYVHACTQHEPGRVVIIASYPVRSTIYHHKRLF